jgi:uncharacterized protein (TIGR00255 family)
MVVSMTGFASHNITITNKAGVSADVVISLKTVNSRFFEAKCRLPYPLAYLETELAKRMKAQLHRGYATFNLSVNNAALFQGTVEPNTLLAQNYLAALARIQQDCNVPGEVAIADLIQIKEIFALQESIIEEDAAIIKPLMKAIDDVVQKVHEARQHEGTVLYEDIMQRHHFANQEIKQIEHKSALDMQRRREALDKELLAFEDQQSEAAQLRKQVLVHELDKTDIHEEVIRFQTHLDALKETLHSKEIEKGRRVDFTLQELSREINTIAAKCSNAEITTHTINVKVELEKAREQAQNII